MERKRGRECGAHVHREEGESCADSMSSEEPDVGLDLTTQRSQPEGKSSLRPNGLPHPGTPVVILLKDYPSLETDSKIFMDEVIKDLGFLQKLCKSREMDAAWTVRDERTVKLGNGHFGLITLFSVLEYV